MADYTPRLKASYNEVVRPAMKEEFAYKNDMMIPKITKITLNLVIV
jgi:large subunit ribosomal protein L5